MLTERFHVRKVNAMKATPLNGSTGKPRPALRLRSKSTRQSHGIPIFYADITVRHGMSMVDALLAAKQLDEQRQAAGFDQEALDQAHP